MHAADASPQSTDRETPRRLVVALGGNAITRDGDDGSVATDYRNLRRSLRGVVELVRRGHQVVITHGNGPQVGNLMLRNELARGKAPDLPLDVMVADLQGGLGYMIGRVLRNHLMREGHQTTVATLLSLVEVDPNDPALDEPSKFVGPAFDASEKDTLVSERGWQMKEDKGRGWRRVVPSPEPIDIVDKELICTVIEAGAVVIVSGGGGIPVRRTRRGLLKGVEAVVDKDYASAVLAKEIGADELYILTAVPQVVLDFGTEDERPLSRMTTSEARRHLADGQFPAGSMGPKVEALCRFVEQTGGRALITDVFTLDQALAGETGTWVTPDEPPAPGAS